jgi:pimeloyl-ACP methyl ester carboxylesterase
MSTSTAAAVKSIRLRGGRVLAYAEFGDPNGRPIVLCHGTPGSRLDRHPDDRIAVDLGARVIVPDRPGYGYSDYQPHRTLLDWPDDVLALADALGLERFAVAGVSGGGPHAAACAYKIPDRLTRVAIVSGIASVDIPHAFDGMARINRVSFVLSRYAPWPLLRSLYALQVRTVLADPEQFIDALAKQMPPPDQAAVSRPEIRALLVENLREAYRQGSKGHCGEDRIFARPWPFRPADIRAEVHLWHGELDTLVPVAHAHYLAGQIPNCHATFVHGAGHILVFDRFAEILTALVA